MAEIFTKKHENETKIVQISTTKYTATVLK